MSAAALAIPADFDTGVELRLTERLGSAGLKIRGTGLTHSGYFSAQFTTEDAARAAAAVLRDELSDIQVWASDPLIRSRSPWRVGGLINQASE